MLRLGGIALQVGFSPRAATYLRKTPLARFAGPEPLKSLTRTGAPDFTRKRLDLDSFTTTELRAIAARINAHDWYHSIDLPQGMTTPGITDHRGQTGLVGLPEDMTGMRALDVATYDGFWAFEMERRGAEVIALDVGAVYDGDIPRRQLEKLPPEGNTATGEGFRLAKELLGSRVERVELNVYDLSPEKVGKFDLVFVSDLLLHLRDPNHAMECIYTVVKDEGCALIAEPYDIELEPYGMPLRRLVPYSHYVWSLPSSSALYTMINVGGFNPIEEVERLPLNYRDSFPIQKVVFRAYPWQAHHQLETPSV